MLLDQPRKYCVSQKNSFHQHNLERWESALKSLFPFELPTHCLWEEPESIINVLQAVSSAENLSHLYLPDGGGVQFAYFWLEAASLKPRDLSSEEENPISEDLTALAPGRYGPLFWKGHPSLF
jgi:hypothetical protein